MKSCNYKELVVWQKSMDLVIEVYDLITKLPSNEKYELSSQMRRAAVSIPSNIAEGHGRNSSQEFCHFLGIARGSACELETQLLVAKKVLYLSEDDVQKANSLIDEVIRMITAMIKKIQTEKGR